MNHSIYDIAKDILIPIVSALIGGLFTFVGIKITLKHEIKKEERIRVDSAKPYFYVSNFAKPDIRIDLHSENGKVVDNKTLQIRNTDNGVMVVKSIKTENKTYIPICGNVIDKNTNACINISFVEGDTLKNITLRIADVYKNEYLYKITIHDKSEFGIFDYQIKEIQ